MVFVKGPGLYSDIGKKARGKDYQGDQKFTLTTYTSNGVAITSSGTRKGDLFLADINTQLKNKNITTDVKVDTYSNVSLTVFLGNISGFYPKILVAMVYTTITVDEPAPGVKAIVSFVAPDQKSGKSDGMKIQCLSGDCGNRWNFQYFHEHAGISTSLGLTAKPIVNFSGVAGNQKAAFGTDISFDTATGNFTKCNAGVSFTTTDLIASLMLNDKGETVTASYFHTVSPLTNTAVGAELTHSFSTNENTLTIGTQHLLDPLTSVKARVNNYGKVSALIQHEWRPKSLITISGEVDSRAIEKSAKVGLAVALKP
ncbi:UNVERIFIED_CONTAM: Mitochondrial outer membrane protein porin of [Sesamum angustifolium]|uniref:Mitochondrial outer membrane protein porin of n=1 Tax=Sesamum angustifolium TaxID=2727405 RepID=A0AAW2Q8F9_9LAMI